MNGPMISIVDDDACVRQGTENVLLSMGFTVATFCSAEEFLASERVDDSSCLITDLKMPGLSGFDLQQRLLDDGKPLPVIFITAFACERFRARAFEAGAVGFLGKPFEERALIECLNRALRGSAFHN